MIKTLLTTLKQDKETFEVPKSVQDAIPIRRLWPDGIFQFGSKFSKTLRFSDINYAIASKEDKTAMFLAGCRVHHQDHHQQQAGQPGGL